MKTITLTKSEIETLETYFWCNPCEVGCIKGYDRIDCHDLRKDGTYRCELMRDMESIRKKLGIDEYKGAE